MPTKALTERVLAQMPATDLPAPGGAAHKPRSLGLRALVSVLMLTGVVVVAFGIFAAGLGLNFLVWKAGRVSVPLLIGTLAIVGALGRSFLTALRAPPDDPSELEVPATAEPVLHEEVRALAAAAGTRAPDRVVFVPQTNAYVHEFGRCFGLLPGTRTLAIGTPLFDGLTVSQLRAVLAHEMGHFASGDTKLGPLTARTDYVLASMVQRLGDTISGRMMARYWHLQSRVSAAVRRGQEITADSAAVRVAGRQAAADALTSVRYIASAQSLLNEAYLYPLLMSGHRPDSVRVGLREIALQRRDELIAHVESGADYADPHDSHPSLHARIANVAALPETFTGDVDDRPARVLLREPDDWIAAADDAWMNVLTGGGLKPVTWESWPEHALAGEHAARAADVDRALAALGLPEGLDGLEAAFEGGRARDLAAELVRTGWRTGSADERDRVLRAAVAAAAESHVIEERGCRWVFSWSENVSLQTKSGKTVELSHAVVQAAEGDFAALKASLRGAGRKRSAKAAAEAKAAKAEQVATAPATVVDDVVDRAPPSPPFVRAGDGWVAKLGRPLRHKSTLHVSADGFSIDGKPFSFVDIAHVTWILEKQQYWGFGGEFRLETRDGRKVKVISGAVTKRKGGSDSVGATWAYLWWLVDTCVAPRRTEEIMAALANGETVVAGGVELSSKGITRGSRIPGRGDKFLPWHQVADPFVEHDHVIIQGFEGNGLHAPLKQRDALVLLHAVPTLRAKFAS